MWIVRSMRSNLDRAETLDLLVFLQKPHERKPVTPKERMGAATFLGSSVCL